MTSYATTASTPKALLSREAFERICIEATANSTNCEAYISNVLAELCHWLEVHAGSTELPEMTWSFGNVQALIISLYQLLEARSELDFNVSVVLNSYAPPYQS